MTRQVLVDQWWAKMLVYGAPGTGKTTLIGTAAGSPALSPGLVLDFEGGLMSIRSKVQHVSVDDLVEELANGEQQPTDTLTAVRIVEWDDVTYLLESLTQTCPFRFVAVDSLTELNYLNLTTIVGAAEAADARRSGGKIELQDYGQSSTAMRAMIRSIRDLPAHILFTALAAKAPNPRTRVDQDVPSLVGKLTAEACGLVDLVGYATIDDAPSAGTDIEAEYVVAFAPGTRWVAKDRTEGGRLNGDIVNATLPTIIELLDTTPPASEPPSDSTPPATPAPPTTPTPSKTKTKKVAS